MSRPAVTSHFGGGFRLSGRGLYENERGAYAVAQMAALAEWRDTAWLRRLDLQRMAG